MKYFVRKIKMMILLKRKVRNDKIRTNEIKQAIVYVFFHPRYLFFKVEFSEIKKINNLDLSVIKNINSIVNTPYYEELYSLYSRC